MSKSLIAFQAKYRAIEMTEKDSKQFIPIPYSFFYSVTGFLKCKIDKDDI